MILFRDFSFFSVVIIESSGGLSEDEIENIVLAAEKFSAPMRFNPRIGSSLSLNPRRLHKDPVGNRVVDRHSDP